MTEPNSNPEPNSNAEPATIPKHRLDQESKKRQAAEQKAQEAQRELQEFKEQLENQESEKDRAKGEFERIAERAQKKAEAAEKKREEAEKRAEEAERSLVTYKQRVSFSNAAAGIILPDAVGVAFGMIPPEDWDGVDLSDTEKVKKLAQHVAEGNSFLADKPRGAGSGGADRPVVMAGTKDAEKKALPFGRFNRRRIN